MVRTKRWPPKDFRTQFDVIIIYAKQSMPLAVDSSEKAVIGLSLKWRQLCVCSLIEHGSRPICCDKNAALLYIDILNKTSDLYNSQDFYIFNFCYFPPGISLALLTVDVFSLDRLLSALAVLTERPNLLEKIIVTRKVISQFSIIDEKS